MNYIFDQKNYGPLYASTKNQRLNSKININNNIKNSTNNIKYIPEIQNQNKNMDFKNIKIYHKKEQFRENRHKDKSFEFKNKHIEKINSNNLKNMNASNNNLNISKNFLNDFKNKIAQDEESENLSKLAEDLLSMSNKKEEEEIVKPRGPINKNDFIGESITFFNINEEWNKNNESHANKNKQFDFMNEMPKMKTQMYISPFQKLNMNLNNNNNANILNNNLINVNMVDTINNSKNIKYVSQNMNINTGNTYYSILENKLENNENNNNNYNIPNNYNNRYKTNNNKIIPLNIRNIGDSYYNKIDVTKLSNYFKNNSKNKNNSQIRKNSSNKNNFKLNSNELINQYNNELYVPKFHDSNLRGNVYSKTDNKSEYNSKNLIDPFSRNIKPQRKSTRLNENKNNEFNQNYGNTNLSRTKNLKNDYFTKIINNSQKITGNRQSQRSHRNMYLNVENDNYFKSSNSIKFNAAASMRKFNSNNNNAKSLNTFLYNKYEN